MIERTTLMRERKKPIRSFVERQGRFSNNAKELLDQFWPLYGLPLTQQKLDLAQIFGRNAPVTLEIGFGDGQSLLELAQKYPERNFIGIEVYKVGIAQLFAGIKAHSLTNIRVFCADAIEVLTNCLIDSTLEQVLLFFPDPWHKLKHHKRRIVQDNFIHLLAAKLQVGGILHMATDWQNYAEHMLAVMLSHENWENLAPNGQFIPRPETRALTKFERRGNTLGHSTWDLMFRKKS